LHIIDTISYLVLRARLSFILSSFFENRITDRKMYKNMIFLNS
jgi:hypothetical protein